MDSLPLSPYPIVRPCRNPAFGTRYLVRKLSANSRDTEWRCLRCSAWNPGNLNGWGLTECATCNTPASCYEEVGAEGEEEDFCEEY